MPWIGGQAKLDTPPSERGKPLAGHEWGTWEWLAQTKLWLVARAIVTARAQGGICWNDCVPLGLTKGHCQPQFDMPAMGGLTKAGTMANVWATGRHRAVTVRCRTTGTEPHRADVAARTLHWHGRADAAAAGHADTMMRAADADLLMGNMTLR